MKYRKSKKKRAILKRNIFMFLLLSVLILISVFAVISKGSDTLFARSPRRAIRGSNYVIKPILFVPADQDADTAWLSQQARILEYIQHWFAVRLDGKTFTSVKPVIFKSSHPLSWFWECHRGNQCTNQITYYEVKNDLQEHGYNTGSPLDTKYILFVFFQGEIKDGWPFLGGVISGPDESDITYITTPGIQELKKINPFNLNVSLFCPFDQGDCVELYKIGVITHELTHTFGLSHVTPIPHYGSIIANPSAFPHVSFDQTGTVSELDHMMNSPFMNTTLATIRSPLSNLTQIRFSLQAGKDTYLSLPLLAPGKSASLTNFLYSIYPFCNKVHIFQDGAENANSWTTYSCAENTTLPAGFTGQGVVIEGLKDVNLTYHGLVDFQTKGVALKKGWNYVGPVRPNYSKSPSKAFSSIINYLTLVYYYDPEDAQDHWKLYDPKVPTFVNDLTTIESNKAYYIQVTTDTFWAQ